VRQHGGGGHPREPWNVASSTQVRLVSLLALPGTSAFWDKGRGDSDGTVEDQRGFRAADVRWEDLADLTEQRVFLESQAIRLAIKRGDLAWESRVLAAHHRLAGTDRLADGTADLAEEWVMAHREFHRVLVEACGSPRLLRFRELLSDQAERYRRWSIRQEPGRDVAGEHRALAEAAVARNTDLAVQCLADHYWRTARLCQLEAGPHNACLLSPADRRTTWPGAAPTTSADPKE